MRHILLPGAITTATRGVQEATAKAHLVAPGGGSLCVVSGPTGAVSGAIDVATIATAADRHLSAAAGTDEQPRRDGIILVTPTRSLMTGAARAATLPRHACPGTMWCTVPKQNLPVGSAPCLPPIVWPRHRRRQPGQSSVAVSTKAYEQSDAAPAAGSPAEFMPKLERRQIYADSDRHRQRCRRGRSRSVCAAGRSPAPER